MQMMGSWCVFYHVVISNEKILHKNVFSLLLSTIPVNLLQAKTWGNEEKKQKCLVWFSCLFSHLE